MSAVTEVDPLNVECPYCRSEPGEGCSTGDRKAARPHKVRVKLALVLAAHADPALDAFPELGPVSDCGLCGTPGLPQRHRIVDAIAGRLAAGESVEECAADYNLLPDAVEAVEAWAQRWPGAWQ